MLGKGDIREEEEEEEKWDGEREREVVKKVNGRVSGDHGGGSRGKRRPGS